jgi:hypothetical protein
MGGMNRGCRVALGLYLAVTRLKRDFAETSEGIKPGKWGGDMWKRLRAASTGAGADWTRAGGVPRLIDLGAGLDSTTALCGCGGGAVSMEERTVTETYLPAEERPILHV